MVAPIVDELAVEYEGRVKVGKVDVDSEQKIAADYGIRSIPTLLIFKDAANWPTRSLARYHKKQLVEKLEALL